MNAPGRLAAVSSTAAEMGEIPKGHIVGMCDLMCPEKEREFRSANGDLEIFERIDRTTGRNQIRIFA